MKKSNENAKRKGKIEPQITHKYDPSAKTVQIYMTVLTALVINPFIVPESAAAIPNLPLFRMCMATLKPLPTPNMM